MICTVCGVRVTHVPTGVTAQISHVYMAPTREMRATAMRVLHQRLWTHRNTPLPLPEVARYEFDGDGSAEFERAENVLEARLSARKL